MFMFTRLLRLVALVLLMLGAAVAAPFALPAATVQASSSCQVSPSNANCTYQDPQLTGCNTDALTIYATEDPGRLRVAVRYSPTCQSAWARVVNLSTFPNSSIIAQIGRNDGVTAARSAALPTTAEVSPMVYLGTRFSAQAIGQLYDQYGILRAQVSTPFVRP